MEKDYFGNIWVEADKDKNQYPIGTKYKAIMGGYWIKVSDGWFKWCNGSTFPNVGADWNVEICLPVEEK